uniref:Ig-like domain-containing protein n=1 Tax=Scleropages formosus TaxID=113540 RepID=A0A8C9VCB6_SCLFO
MSWTRSCSPVGLGFESRLGCLATDWHPDLGATSYWIHWYRQYPGTPPQFILFSGSDSYSAEFAEERFSSSADKSSGKASLSISREELEDSTVYYCAPSQGTPSGTRTPDPPESRTVVQPTAPPHP